MSQAERITELRKARGMPIAELARRSGVSRRTIYNILEGKPADLDTLIGIAGGLDVKLEDLDPGAAERVKAAVA